MVEDGYGGLLGAFPYAIRRSNSRLFQLYGGLAAAVSLFGALLIALGVIQLLAETGRTEGTGAFVRGFYVVVGVAALAPLLAPVLLVARRHRRGSGSSGTYDTALGAAGFGFLGSLYVGLVASTPPAHQEPLEPITLGIGSLSMRVDVFASLGQLLYDLPAIAGLLFPAVGVVAIVLVHRFFR